MSGGQKQRISLARAAYSSASYILLDDPLSAVDAPTARHLLYKCILGPIMSKRTIILVSHAVGLVLPRADFVVVMKNGAISAKGTPRELANGEHLQGIFSAEVLAKGPESFLDENNDMSEVESHEPSLEKSAEDLAHAVGRETEAKKSEQDRKKSGKLVNAEEKATGSVRWAVYWAYLRAAGGIKFFMIFITSYFFMFGADLSFAWW